MGPSLWRSLPFVLAISPPFESTVHPLHYDFALQSLSIARFTLDWVEQHLTLQEEGGDQKEANMGGEHSDFPFGSKRLLLVLYIKSKSWGHTYSAASSLAPRCREVIQCPVAKN